MANNFIAFDLEGPLSPNDNAYELMQLFPHGAQLFEVISRYDDLLTLEGRADYEPGDTLALIVPFLVLHNITEDDIASLAVNAKFTGGAHKLVTDLSYATWKVFCITTTYEQYAIHVTHKLEIFSHNLACTPFPLNKFLQTLTPDERNLIAVAEKDILAIAPSDDAKIKQVLDHFYWEQLPSSEIGKAIKEVKPVGGRRKVAALNKFADKHQQPLSRWVVVGDSITDFRMLRAVEDAGGLAIAFNANGYALPHATMGLASTMLSDLTDVLTAWHKGGRSGAERLVKQREKTDGSGDRNYFHWLSGRKDISDVVQIHARIRRLVREEAAKLG